MRRNLSILWLNSYFGSLLSIFGVLTYLVQNRGAETGWMHVKESIYILKILIQDVTLDHLALQANIRSWFFIL